MLARYAGALLVHPSPAILRFLCLFGKPRCFVSFGGCRDIMDTSRHFEPTTKTLYASTLGSPPLWLLSSSSQERMLERAQNE